MGQPHDQVLMDAVASEFTGSVLADQTPTGGWSAEAYTGMVLPIPRLAPRGGVGRTSGNLGARRDSEG